MAQITSTSSTNSNNSLYATNSSASNTTTSSASTGGDALANESTFLKLLVAQLQNQDPLQPQDGMQFVSQLAQFSDLEQNLAMRSDLDAIKTQVVSSSSAANSTANSSSSVSGSASS